MSDRQRLKRIGRMYRDLKAYLDKVLKYQQISTQKYAQMLDEFDDWKHKAIVRKEALRLALLAVDDLRRQLHEAKS